jgi:hypothetical protein
MSRVRAERTTEGRLRHEDHSTHATCTRVYSSRTSLVQIMIKNLGEGLFTLMTFFNFTESLCNMVAV